MMHTSLLPGPLPAALAPFGLAVVALVSMAALPACASSDMAFKQDEAVFAGEAEMERMALADTYDDSSAGGAAFEMELPAPGAPATRVEALSGGVADGAAPSEPPPPPSGPRVAPTDTPAVQTPAARLIIYRAQLHVIVNDVEQARRRFLTEVEAAGGHLQSSSLQVVVARVPSARFEAVTTQARRLGRVANEQIDAQDVTRQVFELSLRIDNAERARVRLLDLLERGGELEHVIRVEQELRRVTEEIELLKGKRRQLEGEAAFSTITLRLSPHAPPPVPMARRKISPFPWVRGIGPEQVLDMSLVADELPDLLPARFDVPARFVSVEEGPWEVRAVSADGARLWLRTRFVEGADLAFWQIALLEELKETRGYDVMSVERRTTPSSGEALEFLAETSLGGEPLRYQLIVEVSEVPLLGTTMTTLEHVGEIDGFNDAAADLRAALDLTEQPASANKASPSALAVEGQDD